MAISTAHPHSLTARYAKGLLVAPPLAALCYPFLLKAFNAFVTSPGGGSGAISALLLALALGVPIIGIYVCVKLGSIAVMTAGELQAKRLALLSVAAAPIYTAAGVLLYMARNPISDIAVWLVLWGAALVLAVRATWSPGASLAPDKGEVSPRLRMAHGASAAAILLIFLMMHLSNHLAGLWSEAAHRLLMDRFRIVYRAGAIEPIVVTLFLFQVTSGVALLWQYTRRPADVFRTLQIASAAYLVFFILGHMNSVFFYARMFAGIKTDWNFATGAPTGLIKDPWNIRLLPHYLVGVFFVLTHLVLGARVVALAHNFRQPRVDRLAKGGIALAAVIATAIIVGMSGIHLG